MSSRDGLCCRFVLMDRLICYFGVTIVLHGPPVLTLVGGRYVTQLIQTLSKNVVNGWWPLCPIADASHQTMRPCYENMLKAMFFVFETFGKSNG